MRARWVGPALLLALLLAPPGLAQTDGRACRVPVLEVQEAPRTLPPGSAYSLLFAIENPNGPNVDAVRATVTTTAPAGWTAVPAQRDVTLGPRNVSVNALAITAPNRGTGEASGNITILVTFVCTIGDIQTSAFATRAVPVAIEGFHLPWPLIVAAFALLAGGFATLAFRRLRRGVAMSAPQSERAVAPGKSVKFTLSVENRRGRPQSLRLVHEGLPEGWSLHLALADVELEPGEEKALWALLKAPLQARPGHEVALALRLLAPDGREVARLPLVARVAADA